VRTAIEKSKSVEVVLDKQRIGRATAKDVLEAFGG
jgi:hypothetical protein